MDIFSFQIMFFNWWAKVTNALYFLHDTNLTNTVRNFLESFSFQIMFFNWWTKVTNVLYFLHDGA